MFGTSDDTSSDGFQNYYKDLSQRLKNRELDLVIVVNMFLTGFDATTLNTLFVDKNLRAHGLIQAYSRTNRILNSVKTYGNIVSFRNLEKETNEALELFGDKDPSGIVLLKPYGEYFGDYAGKVEELLGTYSLSDGIPASEEDQKEFIKLFGKILKLWNILGSFDEFADDDMLNARDEQDYRSVYLELYRQFSQNRDGDKEAIRDDVVFEIELIKQVEVNVDYILLLVEKARKERGDGEDKEIRAEISRALDASPTLRNKRDLVERFVDSVSIDGEVDDEWDAFIAARREEELGAIVAEERLKPQEAKDYMDRALRDGEMRTSGTEITRVLPPLSRFGRGNAHSDQKRRVIEKLEAFFDRFRGLGI